MSRRPVIGITGPNEGGTAAWLFTAISVILAGGHPLRIKTDSPEIMENLDGLIIGGGADVEPMMYGQQRIDKAPLKKDGKSLLEWLLSILFFPVYWFARYLQHTKSSPIDIERDELELGLLRDALKSNKPILGICRGMQLINVHFKGSLHQDISGFYGEKTQISTILPRKQVQIKEGSLLHDILKNDCCNVNALHKQAIDSEGEGLDRVAKEAHTNVWQAIEHEDYNFVLGVQWHPEYLIQVSSQRNIFRRLVETAVQNS